MNTAMYRIVALQTKPQDSGGMWRCGDHRKIYTNFNVRSLHISIVGASLMQGYGINDGLVGRQAAVNAVQQPTTKMAAGWIKGLQRFKCHREKTLKVYSDLFSILGFALPRNSCVHKHKGKNEVLLFLCRHSPFEFQSLGTQYNGGVEWNDSLPAH